MHLKLKEKQNEEGFTLIELLVVVIIIGILAAIAIPVFLSQRERGWQAALISDVRNAALEVEAERTSQLGSTPAQADGQAILTAFGTTNAEATLTYSTDGDDFCVTGDDTRLDDDQVYDSSENGMLDPGQACTL